MLADEMSPRSFVKKNNSYSHCPLKKRPVQVMEDVEERPEIRQDEIIDVVDDIPEPENLSLKPEDLTRASTRIRIRSPAPNPPSVINPVKVTAPAFGHQPIHPVAKKARVAIIQHSASPMSTPPAMHFLPTKTPLEPLNLNTPIEPLPHYPTWNVARSPPLYPPHYLPYQSYRYHHPGTDIYPYPVPNYPHSSESVSPPPQPDLSCPIQRPIPRTYPHWASPDHCGLSPGSLSSGSIPSLRSPPPVAAEDLSSPGSDSGRSSAGSTSAGTKKDVPTRYNCPDCGKSYSTYSGLSKHQQFHCASAHGQPQRTFTCKSCPKVYVSLGALKMHIRTHTLPCKCLECGKAFSRPWLLQGHIRTHTGEKPFTCPHCNRAFADRSNLRAHLQTHSDVKKYSCPSCSKTFSRMSLLTKHQEGGCPGAGPHFC